MNLAELARANDVKGLLELRHAALLRAHLHDARVLVLGLDHGGPFAGVVREGLFDVDILAGGAGVDRNGRVPVIGSGDEDRVDIAAVQDGAVILGGEGFAADRFLACGDVLVPHVAKSDDLHAGDSLQGPQQLPAATANADQRHADRVVGRERAGRGP